MEDFIEYCKEHNVSEAAIAKLKKDVKSYNVAANVQYVNREYKSLGKKLVLKVDGVLVEYEPSAGTLIKSQTLGLNIQTELL